MASTTILAMRLVLGLLMYEVVRAQNPVFSFTPNIKFNYTIPAMSPQFMFTPSFQLAYWEKQAGGNTTAMWNTSFSETPWSSYVPGQVGVGTAKSWVSGYLGTALNFKYIGTGSWISGSFNWTNTTLPDSGDLLTSPGFSPGDLSITLDVVRGKNWLNQTGQNGLSFTERTGSFAGRSKSDFVFEVDSVTVETGLVANVSSLDQVQTHVEYMVVNGSLNPYYKWTGPSVRGDGEYYNTIDWQISSELDGVAGQQPPSPWQGQKTAISKTYDSKVGLPLPLGTTYVIVNATTGPDKWWAEVFLTPERPGVQVIRTAMLNNPWVSVQTIFQAPLDPTLNYNLTILPTTDQYDNVINTTKGFDPAYVSLHSIQFFYAGDLPKNATAAPGGTQHGAKKSSAGAIAGGVVGGVVALALLAFAVWFIRRRHRNTDKGKFEIEDSPPEYKNVDESGYTDQALLGGGQTAPLLGAGAGAAIAREGTNHSTTYPPQPVVMHALDSEAVPFVAGGAAAHSLDTEDNLAPVAVRALDSEEVASPSSAGPSPSTAAMVAMPQYKLDALLGVLPGDRSGKAANEMVRVPQAKVDLLAGSGAGAGASSAPQSDRIVSMPQRELEALLGMAVSNAPEGSDTVLSMPQYKIDLLRADSVKAPPGYQA